MMKKLYWALFVTMFLILHINTAYGSVVAKVNLVLKVVDDEGKPVSDVNIDGGGWIPGRYRAAHVDGITDENGEFKTRFRTAVEFGFSFKKEGYYESRMLRYVSTVPEPRIVKGYWQPNPIKETVVLKRIKNPVPMYVKGVDEKVPVMGKPVGYDLMAGDWVAPYGKGTVADFIINVIGEYKSFYEREMKMTVTFFNEKDGIQSFKSLPFYTGAPLGSEFWSSYEAPLDGYEPVYEYESITTLEAEGRKNPGQRKNMNFYFRVRTQLDEDGNIKKAMYGKIYKDLYCHFWGKELRVAFVYYLNPDGTRNMEADTRKNLFGENVNVGIVP